MTADSSRRLPTRLLEPWIDWLALKGQDAEDAFVDPPQRLAADESVQALDAEREFAERRGSAWLRGRGSGGGSRFSGRSYSGP